MAQTAEEIAATAGSVAAQVEERIAEAESGAAIVVERAVEAIDAANERAEDIARAAMETVLGRRIDVLEQERTEWHQEREGLRQDLSAATADLSSLREQLTALGVLTAAALTRPHSEAPSLSIPQPSTGEVEAASATVQDLLPADLTLEKPLEPVAPVAPTAQKHLLI